MCMPLIWLQNSTGITLKPPDISEASNSNPFLSNLSQCWEVTFRKGGLDVRGLLIPDAHQKTTPLYIISQRCTDTLSGGHWRLLTLACSHLCSPELTWGPPWSSKAYLCSCILIYCQSATYLFSIIPFIFYYGTICYISLPQSVFIYISPPSQWSPFFPLQIPARSVSIPYFTLLLHVMILSLDLC